SASPKHVSAIATAARFSSGAASSPSTRANAAQSPAIFRRVVSSNGRFIRLDYNTTVSEEMTRAHPSTKARYDRKDRRQDEIRRLEDGRDHRLPHVDRPAVAARCRQPA